ncbi:uncharacterized protein [Euphorbia lathyris]|uniref:uncharacterized protein isoform X2 n=1 Tax=Euphorbia lathyris TaxID=212925 RepID=UPI0033138378
MAISVSSSATEISAANYSQLLLQSSNLLLSSNFRNLVRFSSGSAGSDVTGMRPCESRGRRFEKLAKAPLLWRLWISHLRSSAMKLLFHSGSKYDEAIANYETTRSLSTYAGLAYTYHLHCRSNCMLPQGWNQMISFAQKCCESDDHTPR